jgi:hypothetical protein
MTRQYFKVFAGACIPAVAAMGLTACASATTTCVVQHRYAIVVFQNGLGNNSRHLVRRFELTVKYGPNNFTRRTIYSRIVLRAASGGNPPVIVRSYRVGKAVGCHADKVTAHR